MNPHRSPAAAGEQEALPAGRFANSPLRAGFPTLRASLRAVPAFHAQRDPCRSVIARVLSPTHVAIDTCINEALRGLRI